MSVSTEELSPDVLPELDVPVTPEPEAERHLRAVPPRRRRQPRVALWLGSIVTGGSLFLLVAFNVFMVQGQFDLNRIAQERSIEQNQYAHLRALVAQRSAPDVIIQKALARGWINASMPVKFVQAPPAAPSGPSASDQTATTQQQ